MSDLTTDSPMKYLNPTWESVLKTMGIATFENWWNQTDEAVEPANTKAGRPDAWSKVSVLKTPCGKALFLKRQENFYPNNLIQKWRKQLTFEREYTNYLKIRKANIPTYELVFFDSRNLNGNRQAVYVCKGLDGFTALPDLMTIWKREGWPATSERKKMINVLVKTLLHMHGKGILHNALSPRHLFFNISEEDPYDFPENLELRLIDFERLKKLKKGSDQGIQRDLSSLNRRCVGWPAKDQIRVLRQYLGIDKLDANAKQIVRTILARTRRLDARSKRKKR